MKRLLVVLLVCGTASGRAGERAGIRAMGMGRTFVAAAQGLDAAGVNPAGIVRDGALIELSLLPFSAHVGTDFIDYDLYTTYFTGEVTKNGRQARLLTQADKERILETFGHGVGTANLDLEARPVGLAIHPVRSFAIAMTVAEEVRIAGAIPRDYADFFLNGNPPGSTFDFNGTDLRAAWTREYALGLSWETSIPGFASAFAIGAAVKLVHGYGYYRIDRFNTTLTTGEDGSLTGDIHFLSTRSGANILENRFVRTYGIAPPVAGSGLGADIGVSARLESFLTVGMSITDIGNIRWTEGTEEAYVDTTIVIDDPFVVQQGDVIERVLRGERRAGVPFTSHLPTTIRLGLLLQVNELPGMEEMPGSLQFAFDYNQGLQETSSSTTTPRFSFGTEYAPVPVIPLRAGVSFGGTDHLNLALGFGLHAGPFSWDIASENVTWLFSPGSFSHISFATGFALRF